MARADQLPVYKACYDLLLYVLNWSVKVQRDLRYTVAEDLKKRLIEVELCIYKANKSVGTTKLVQVQRAQELLSESFIYLRLLNDMHQITLDQYAHTSELAVEVEKQLANWERHLQNKDGGQCETV